MAQKRKGGVSEESFDDFPADEGLLTECEEHALTKVIAAQLVSAMEEQGITKVEMATRMKTSRRSKPCAAVGRSRRVELF